MPSKLGLPADEQAQARGARTMDRGRAVHVDADLKSSGTLKSVETNRLDFCDLILIYLN